MNNFTACFDTVYGEASLTWSAKGLLALELPRASSFSSQEAKNGGLQENPEIAWNPGPFREAPSWVEKAAFKIYLHLTRCPQDFADVPVDYSFCKSEFVQEVYERLRKLPCGRTISYGELALLVGHPGASRAVGRAMSTNPLPLVIPCHRVVKSDGKLGNYSALAGTASKAQLLEWESSASPVAVALI